MRRGCDGAGCAWEERKFTRGDLELGLKFTRNVLELGRPWDDAQNSNVPIASPHALTLPCRREEPLSAVVPR